MTKKIGPNFNDDLRKAGLEDIPIQWSSDGQVFGLENLNEKTRKKVEKVIASHQADPDPGPLITAQLILNRMAEAGVDADEFARQLLANAPGEFLRFAARGGWRKAQIEALLLAGGVSASAARRISQV